MKDMRISRSYSILLFCMLFGSPLLVVAADATNAAPAATQKQDVAYICFDKSMSDITRVVYEISALDANENSPIHLLKRYIENGYLLAIHDEIIQVLEYANWFVGQLEEGATKQKVSANLDRVIEQVLNGTLTMNEDAIMRAPHLKLLVINERMHVAGKSLFKSDVIINKKLRTHGKGRFYKDVEFKKNVTVNGTLSVNDAVINNGIIINLSATDTVTTELSVSDAAVIGCNLTVGCNINIPESTDTAHGNIVKNGTTFIHNFGTNNTFVGENSGNFTMSGNGSNTGLGINTLAANATGFSNTAVGASALQQNTSFFNTAVGSSALARHISGERNTGIGASTLFNMETGTNNTAVGFGAMNGSTLHQTLNRNTSIGSFSLNFIQTGDSNTVLGQAAGVNFLNGDNNIFIGRLAGQTLENGDNNIYISNDGVEPESNTIRVGNIQTSFFAAGIRGVTTGLADAVPVLIDSTGQLGTINSSAAVKRAIQQVTDESAAILKLNPVSFIYKKDESQTRQFGLIAEEVDEVFPKLVIRDKDGAPMTVRYEVLPVLIINEMKKLVDKVATMDETFTNKTAAMEKEIAMLKELLKRVTARS